MTDKNIDNIRRIALTDKLLKLIPSVVPSQDKASIGATRGVGVSAQFDPCQLLYTSTAGIYAFADLVDGVAGTPKVTDGKNNHCSFVNTITGMRETGASPTLGLILKPDGFFLAALPAYVPIPIPADTPWSQTEDINLISNSAKYESKSSATGAPIDTSIYGGVNQLDVICTPIVIDWIPHGIWTCSGGNGTLGTEYFYPGYNITKISNTYPISYLGPHSLFLQKGVEYQYTYYYGVFQFTARPTSYPAPTNSFQLAIDVNSTRLWKPNPLETTAPLKYSSGVSTVTMDFGVGYGRKGVITPAKDGGFMLYETSGGVPINNVYVYRLDRTLATIVPASQIKAYLP
jgi:hypothetical protein